MSSLLVFLPPGSPTGTTEWAYALTADGHAVADHGRSPAALLPQPRGAGAEVVAVVPVQALAWHRVELPGATPLGSSTRCQARAWTGTTATTSAPAPRGSGSSAARATPCSAIILPSDVRA